MKNIFILLVPSFFSLFLLGAELKTSASNDENLLEVRDIPCFTCGTLRAMKPLPAQATVQDYEELIEKGCWRVGKWIYPPCPHCFQRLSRIEIASFITKNFKENYLFNGFKKWNQNYKKIYQSLSFEFISSEAVNPEIFSLYLNSEGVHGNAEAFKNNYGSSPLGALDNEILKKLNAGDFNVNGTGSVFVLLKSKEKSVAALLIDIANKWIGFKIFWYKDPNTTTNKIIMTKICWLKLFEIADRLKFTYAQISYFDPYNSRLLYKVNYGDILEINTHHNGKWVLLKDLVKLKTDGDKGRIIDDLPDYCDKIAIKS
jgi:arginyl-tRNA--protein-N-Asp/Glu arginylyltransferase